MEKPREESQILEDLATLAALPGYVHAVAHICHRDNVIHIKGNLKPSDMDRLFSRERLIRTELTTLIGLMAKNPLNLSQLPSDVVEGYVKRTDVLMEELHNAMSYPMFAAMFEAVKAGTKPPDPWRGPGMREPIFYGTESAYAFQYRDLVPEKYGADARCLGSARVDGADAVSQLVLETEKVSDDPRLEHGRHGRLCVPEDSPLRPDLKLDATRLLFDF